ncbi:hypothetical protein DSO57_1003739 [Entomophthora muscae]|uniref:Uncharacterized protein n=1 Tax=Entomophthora muscae TaxID=34485 RepID=A0ACC2SXH2_9FUNG|nr:hypothetical protein DSO57_1003739 [Entomophthora muscae]
MMDPNLPYTIADYGEWGNPNNLTYFNYIQQYSPYDNIPTKPTHFPDLFVRSSLNDDQVQFWGNHETKHN